MDVRIRPDTAAVAELAADMVEAALARPAPVIGLATGATPLATYAALERRHRREGLEFDHANYVLLDEYVGLAPDHRCSYRRTIAEVFTDRVAIPADRVHGPDGSATNLERAASSYEELLAAIGPVTLQILGIGRDGHIGFNEPMSSLASRTRLKTLRPETRRDNQRYFDDTESVPHHALTMGIGTILEARHLVLLATGAAKAPAIAAAVEGPVTAAVPASALQFHRRATVIVDEQAAAELEELDYFRYAEAHRPEWQGP